jgi:DNA-binding transcriptional LysR family regulator
VLTPAELSIELHGELNGQPFLPQQGELFGSVLSLREGQDFFASRELVIRLQQPVTGALRLDVLPGDQGPLPEIEVSWLLPEQELPEARRLSHGYTLHLNLQPLPPNKLAGDFHLVLPAQFKTTLSGRIEVFRDGLRYRDGKVDRHVDSSDTLAYVIWEFEKGGRELRVHADGQLTYNTTAQELNAAIAGLGLAYVPEGMAKPYLLKGRLKRVLEDWCLPYSGYHLWYPSRRQSSAAFALLVDALRYRD